MGCAGELFPFMLFVESDAGADNDGLRCGSGTEPLDCVFVVAVCGVLLSFEVGEADFVCSGCFACAWWTDDEDHVAIRVSRLEGPGLALPAVGYRRALFGLARLAGWHVAAAPLGVVGCGGEGWVVVDGGAGAFAAFPAQELPGFEEVSCLDVGG